MGKSKEMKKYDIVSYVCKDLTTRDAVITGFNMDGTVDLAYVQMYDSLNARVRYEQDIAKDRIVGRKPQLKTILPYKQNQLVRYHVDENNYFSANILQVGPVDTVKIQLGESFVTTAGTDYKTGDTIETNVRDIYCVENVFQEYDSTNPEGKNAYEPADVKTAKLTKNAKTVMMLFVLFYVILLGGTYVIPHIKDYLEAKKTMVEEMKPKYDPEKWIEYGDIMQYRTEAQNPDNLGPVEFSLGLYFNEKFEDISTEKLRSISQVDIDMNKYTDGGQYQYTVYLFDKDIEKKFQIKFHSAQAMDTYNFYVLPNLTKLKIDADSLKTISFLTEMSSLKTLELEAEDLTDLTPLAKTHIEDLGIFLSGEDITGIGGPILEMQDLKKIRVSSGYVLFQDVKGKNESVKEFEATISKDFSYLKHFPNLENIDIHSNNNYVSIGKSVKSISAKKLTKLKKISLNGVRLGEDFAEVLNLPEIQEVYLEECDVAMDFEQLKYNSKLHTLHWKNSQFLENIRDHEFGFVYDVYGDESTLSDHDDFLTHYPNLKNLAIVGEKLESLDEILKFKDLEVLDISDNSIKSLEPLKELTELKELKVTNNPLGGDAEKYGLPKSVQIEK